MVYAWNNQEARYTWRPAGEALESDEADEDTLTRDQREVLTREKTHQAPGAASASFDMSLMKEVLGNGQEEPSAGRHPASDVPDEEAIDVVWNRKPNTPTTRQARRAAKRQRRRARAKGRTLVPEPVAEDPSVVFSGLTGHGTWQTARCRPNEEPGSFNRKFQGDEYEDVETWVAQLSRYAYKRSMSDEDLARRIWTLVGKQVQTKFWLLTSKERMSGKALLSAMLHHWGPITRGDRAIFSFNTATLDAGMTCSDLLDDLIIERRRGWPDEDQQSKEARRSILRRFYEALPEGAMKKIVGQYCLTRAGPVPDAWRQDVLELCYNVTRWERDEELWQRQQPITTPDLDEEDFNVTVWGEEDSRSGEPPRWAQYPASQGGECPTTRTIESEGSGQPPRGREGSRTSRGDHAGDFFRV